MGPLLIKSMGGIQSKFTWKVIPDLFQTELLIYTPRETQLLKLPSNFNKPCIAS